MKSKLLFILHLAPPVHGASVVGSYIQESKFIHDVFDSTFINLSTASDLSNIGKSSVKKIIYIFRLYIKIISFLFKNKIDLCYLTINAKGPAWLKELLIVAILKSFRVRIIYHYHNKGIRLNANSFWKRELYKFQFRQTKTILLSNLLKEDISLFVSDQNIYVCPNGIPHSGKSKLKHKPKEFCQILFLSNLIESKGIFVLLDACRLLNEKNIPFRCIYIGGEGDISGIELKEKIEQYGLDKFVQYQGKKYGLEKEKSFAEADIFAFPTYYHNEALGLVILEAMQNSLPVISTREGAIPDIVIDGITGFLVPKKNPQALADKLEILISNPELRIEMGLAGKKLFEEKLTLEVFEKRMVEILQTVLNDSIA